MAIERELSQWGRFVGMLPEREWDWRKDELRVVLTRLQNDGFDLAAICNTLKIAVNENAKASETHQMLTEMKPWIRMQDPMVNTIEKFEQLVCEYLRKMDDRKKDTLRQTAPSWNLFSTGTADEVPRMAREIIDRLKTDPVYTASTNRPKGNQPEPWKNKAEAALRDMSVPKAATDALLRLYNLKPYDS